MTSPSGVGPAAPAAGQGPSTPAAASQAAAHLQQSRRWAVDSSSAAGAPPALLLSTAGGAAAPPPAALLLQPSLPHAANPAWRRAPSFAAAAALLVPPAVDAGASNGKAHAASAADLAAAAAAANGVGLVGRVAWALGARGTFFVLGTPYSHLQGLPHRQSQLLPMTLANLPARELAGDASASGASGGGGARGGGNSSAEGQRQLAAALFSEVAADQTSGGLRCLGWVLCHLFRWLFGGEIYVDAAGLQGLRGLYGEPGGASLVYIPAHKSHCDYLLLSYVLFGCGLPCPHIAAGANLRLPLVGRLLRACGAFFIRRTSRGAPDSHLYKAVLAAYVRALLQGGHSLEFFIEGGRSRDGRVNPAKLGLLRMVVDAAAAEGSAARPIWLVPTAMNYDAVLEEAALADQLAGAPKKGESLAGLTGTCWRVLAKAVRARWQRWALGLGAGGYCGRATVAFGEPISLQAWLQEHAGELRSSAHAQRAAVAALGEQVTAAIRSASALPTSALLLAALFEQQHAAAMAAKPAAGDPQQQQQQPGGSGASIAAAAAGMEWLADLLEQRGAAVMRLPRDAAANGKQQALLLHVARMVPRCCSVSLVQPGTSGGSKQQQQQQQQQQPVLHLRRGVQAVLLQHARLNQLLPWLGAEGLLAAPLAAAGPAGLSRAALLEEAAWLRCVLAPEIDTALGPGALTRAADFQPALQRLQASGAVQASSPDGTLRLAAGDGSGRRAALLAAALLAPLLASYQQALRGMQAALTAAGPGGATSKALCSAAQKRLLALAATITADDSGSSGSSSSELEAGSSQSAALVVPSVALVQNALKSFAALGALEPAPASIAAPHANGSAPASAAAAGTPAAKPAGLQAAAAHDKPASAGAQVLQAAGSGVSAGSGGAVDEEYAVEPPTPQHSPGSAPLPPAPGPDEHEQPTLGRLSFERRRARLQAAQAREQRGGDASSASDSELDPMAESVAAHLCRLDSSPPAAKAPPAASPAAAPVAGPRVLAPAAAAAAEAAASNEARWVAAQPPAAEQLAGRLAALLAPFVA